MCWQISLSRREQEKISERKEENEEERKPSGKPFQSDPSSLCVLACVYASVCVIFPASSSCLPSLILSCRSSRLVLPDPISASKCHNQPFVLSLVLTLPLRQARRTLPQSNPPCHFEPSPVNVTPRPAPDPPHSSLPLAPGALAN